MKDPKITMVLRVATKRDFFDMTDKPLYGTMYFAYGVKSEAFDHQPYYFTEHTDKETFRELYQHKQLYVPVKIFDEVEIN